MITRAHQNHMSEIVQLLEALPPEDEFRKFEQQVTKMIMTFATREVIYELETQLEQPAGDLDDRIAYNIFIALETYYRHMKDPKKVEALFGTYGSRFRNHPSFNHFDLLRYVNTDLGSEWNSIFQRAYKNSESGNPGCCNLFAELVIYHYEHCEEQNVDTQTRETWLSRAENAICQARAQEDYPKFRCTQGRLLSLLGRFEEAEQLIQSAIDQEPSSQTDYVLRIGNYQYHLLLVQERRHISRLKAEINSQTSRMKEEMDQYVQSIEAEHSKIQDSLIKNIEYLGLFAGIVSFVIGSLSLAGSSADTSFPGAAGLIMVLFGTLLGVFSGFTFMLHGLRERRWIAPVIVFMVSALILAGGLILCFNV